MKVYTTTESYLKKMRDAQTHHHSSCILNNYMKPRAPRLAVSLSNAVLNLSTTSFIILQKLQATTHQRPSIQIW